MITEPIESGNAADSITRSGSGIRKSQLSSFGQ
jgi:hypothetical protein